MTAQPLAPVIPSSGLSAARQHTKSAAGRRPMPLARPVPVPTAPEDVVYGIGRIDASVRIADRTVVSAPGWRGGTAMTDHDWIHFACHAGPLDTVDGTVNRGFTLRDGDLTISELAAQAGHQGGLAFLSACQTAAGSNDRLDEALHLAASMPFIGYSHVVAPMWPIKDAPAQLAARIFYTTLAQGDRGTASALRAAITKLREAVRPTPSCGHHTRSTATKPVAGPANTAGPQSKCPEHVPN